MIKNFVFIAFLLSCDFPGKTDSKTSSVEEKIVPLTEHLVNNIAFQQPIDYGNPMWLINKELIIYPPLNNSTSIYTGWKYNTENDFQKTSFYKKTFTKGGLHSCTLTAKTSSGIEFPIKNNAIRVMAGGNMQFTDRESLEGITETVTVVADFDNDGDLDIWLSGLSSDSSGGGNDVISKLYTNDGFGNFGTAKENFSRIREGNAKVADFNNDGKLDLIVSGIGSLFGKHTTMLQLATSISPLNYSLKKEFNDLWYTAVAIGDVDRDGDIDVVMTGKMDSSQKSQVKSIFYKNNGYGTLTEYYCYENSLAVKDPQFGDIDGDGDIDLVLTGMNSNFLPGIKVLKNDGSGNFTEFDSKLPPSNSTNTVLADFDNDKDLDVVLNGLIQIDNATQITTKLFLNNGNGTFVQSQEEFLPFVSTLVSGDIDGDGDIDLITTGFNNNNITYKGITYRKQTPVELIYQNNGNGTFSIPESFTIESSVLMQGSLVTADFNNDNKLDLYLTGITTDRTSRLSAVLFNH